MTDHVKARLYVDAPLAAGAEVVPAPEQAHYLLNVLRLKPGDAVALFNGRDGEWLSRIADASKKACRLAVGRQARPQRHGPDLWYLFAPIKRARFDFVVEKATELGARRIQPVFTRRTAVARVNLDRLGAHAVEAAEQCGRLDVPQIDDARSLDAVVDAWPAGRRLMLCDESRTAPPVIRALTEARADSPGGVGPWAVLIGPEGGFAPEELIRLKRLPGVLPVSLGPLILRAETAGIAALALWQAMLGDWDNASA